MGISIASRYVEAGVQSEEQRDRRDCSSEHSARRYESERTFSTLYFFFSITTPGGLGDLIIPAGVYINACFSTFPVFKLCRELLGAVELLISTLG